MHLSLSDFLPPDDPQEFMFTWETKDKDEWVVENLGLSRTKKELDLFDSKWFDYRNLHPLDATLIFAEEYKRQYSRIMTVHGRDDYRRAPFKTGLKRVPFIRLPKSNITSLWKARQKADELGLEYDYFIQTMLTAAARREWRELPRPQHLWQEDLLEILANKTSKREGIRLNGSVRSYFKSEEYTGTPLQEAHRRFVMKQISDAKPGKRHLLIYSAVFSLRYIDEQIATSQFPDDMRKALRFV